MLPTRSEGSYQALHLESTLQDLPLHHFDIDVNRLSAELAQTLEQHPLLPGAVLLADGKFVGMLARQRVLEFLARPHGQTLFLKEPLWVLHSYARSELLMLSGETTILVAAQQALRRSPELLNEPIVVQHEQIYYLLDVHELNIAHWQIRGVETQVRYERMQAQMIQTDKMANLGRLVDGVAHEILDPVSFIWGNLSHISTYSREMLELLQLYEKCLPNPPAELIEFQETIELEYMRQDLPRAIESVKVGAERLSKLATSLQNFCHIDEVYPKPADLHKLLDGILLLLKSRLTSEIQINKHYGHLPPVLCYPGQLNQVFMNILSTCLDRLLNQTVSQQFELDFKPRRYQDQPTPAIVKPTIEITTQVRSAAAVGGYAARWVAIAIADNGSELSASAQQQLLESFSVKNRAEKETSLAVSYQIVTAKHGGKFEVRSRNAHQPIGDNPTPPGNHLTGIEFEISLPLN